MHCRLFTQYAVVMVHFLAGLRKIKLLAACLIATLLRECHLQFYSLKPCGTAAMGSSQSGVTPELH